MKPKDKHGEKTLASANKKFNKKNAASKAAPKKMGKKK
jgi:hypothetical protein